MDRKKTVLLHIQKYCMEIEENFEFFGTQVDTFKMNNIFRDSVSMKMFQIGELTNKLNEIDKEFINKTEKEVPWKSIIRMRDSFEHHYENMDLDIIFDVALNDISKLYEFIKKKLKK